MEDLLAAHGTMMTGLVDSPGEFRDCEVGVYKGPVAVHMAPGPEDVPALMKALMDWSKSSDIHPLIKGCIFHCRFEYIHPFVDGNGRMGRLWHSLILSRWRSAFRYLPIESWINMNKKGYYNSLREADKGNIDVFIKYMLNITKAAADEFIDEATFVQKKDLNIRRSILDAISEDPCVTAEGMAKMIGVSGRTVKRHLSSMTKAGMIKRTGSDKTGHWEIICTPHSAP
jgi:Fic family protein